MGRSWLLKVDEVSLTSDKSTLVLINPEYLDLDGSVAIACRMVAFSLPDGLKPGHVVKVTIEKVDK